MKPQTDPITTTFLNFLWDLTGIDLPYYLGQILIYLAILIGAVLTLCEIV